MIDIHSHILSGMDDGPDTLAGSVKIAKRAYAQGITAIFATPHSMNGVYKCPPQEIIINCALLTAELNNSNIPVHVLPGSEVHLTHDTLSLYDSGRLMTLNNMGRYILMELPSMFIIDGVIHIVRKLAERGVTTIIAHPERNPSIIKKLNIISKLIHEGALMQITATSLMGGFGKRAMKICEKMVDKSVVSFIASDIHPGRKLMMLNAYNKTCSIAGEKAAEELFQKNPEQIMLSGVKGMNYAE